MNGFVRGCSFNGQITLLHLDTTILGYHNPGLVRARLKSIDILLLVTSRVRNAKITAEVVSLLIVYIAHGPTLPNLINADNAETWQPFGCQPFHKCPSA